MPPSLRPGLVLLAVAAAIAIGAAPASAATNYVPSGFGETTLADSVGSLSPDSDAIVDVTWAPDGRMFMADRAGLVYVHNPGDPADVNHVVLDIADHVNNGPGTDHGLLGIATDKNFASNGLLYLLYTYDTDTTEDVDPKVSVLTRVVVHPDNSVDGGVNSPTESPILGTKQAPEGGSDGACGPPANDNDCIPSEGKSHSIGTVRVAPDGSLWVGTGDGSDYTIVDPLAANDGNPETYRGKTMHIAPNGQGLPEHPFCAGEPDVSKVCTKVFAGGMRNPFRFTLLPTGGLAIGDVGQDAWEEIDLAHGGENFGWPCYEGSGRDHFQSDGYQSLQYCQDLTDSDVTPPALPVQHDDSQCSPSTPTGNTIVGGPVYEGDQYPAGYRGQLFFGDVGDIGVPGCGWIGRANISGNSLTNNQAFATNWPVGVDLESAPDGNLAYVSLGDNAVREIVYGPGNHRPAVSASATPSSGSPPLTVSLKSAASDPDGDPLTYDWDFRDGSPHSSSPNPTHVYASAQNWVATVTVDDGRGMSASASVTIPVGVGGGGGAAGTPVKVARLRLSAGIARLLKRGVLEGSFTSPNVVKTLDVSLWRGRAFSSSCRWWSRSAHKLRRGACKRPHWMKATLHRRGTHYTWTLKLGAVPAPGTYTLVLQVIPRNSQLAPSPRLRRTIHVRR